MIKAWYWPVGVAIQMEKMCIRDSLYPDQFPRPDGGPKRGVAPGHRPARGRLRRGLRQKIFAAQPRRFHPARPLSAGDAGAAGHLGGLRAGPGGRRDPDAFFPRGRALHHRKHPLLSLIHISTSRPSRPVRFSSSPAPKPIRASSAKRPTVEMCIRDSPGIEQQPGFGCCRGRAPR